ncbi:MAG: LemA family protein, partial [Thermaurantiacus sp.]
MIHLLRLPVLGLMLLGLAACGINTIPTREEAAKAKWADVENQYQRRADLVPNLVATVQGFAAQERAVLTEVTEARARASSVQLSAEDLS